MKSKETLTHVDEPLESSGGNGDRFEFSSRRLGPDLGLEQLGCSVYLVPPGKRAFPYHAHSVMEELFIILDGEGTLRHEGREYPVRAGHVIAAPLGEAHQLINSSGEDLRYLAVSNQKPSDVVLYPDSGKLLAYSQAFGKALHHVSRLDDGVDYYDGEA